MERRGSAFGTIILKILLICGQKEYVCSLPEAESTKAVHGLIRFLGLLHS